ncbi:hypothetical protein ACWDYH_15370 [Nocardia goodfellowii]
MPTEDPKIPPYTENPYSATWEHPKIKNTFDQIKTDLANDAAAKYAQAKDKWSAGLEAFRQRMNTVIAESWDGNSAEASKAAITRYTTAASSLTDSFAAMAVQITAAADAATKTKNALPVPYETVGFTLDHTPWNSKVREGKRREAEDEAREKMDLNYVKPFAAVDSSLPVLASPIEVTSPTENGEPLEIATPVQPVVNDDNSPKDQAPSKPTNEPEASEKEPTDEVPEQDDPSDKLTNPSQNSPSDTDTTPASTNPAAIDPASTMPASKVPTTGNPASSVPNTGSPAIPGTSGVPGTPGTTPGPGRTVQGVPLTTTGNPASTSATTAAASGTKSGMPGMMAPGAAGGRGKDDPAEHKTADYLITKQNAIDLLGTTPPASPAVFGGDVPAANVRSTDDTRPPAAPRRSTDLASHTMPGPQRSEGSRPTAGPTTPDAGDPKLPPLRRNANGPVVREVEDTGSLSPSRDADAPRPAGPLRRRPPDSDRRPGPSRATDGA